MGRRISFTACRRDGHSVWVTLVSDLGFLEDNNYKIVLELTIKAMRVYKNQNFVE